MLAKGYIELRIEILLLLGSLFRGKDDVTTSLDVYKVIRGSYLLLPGG